MVQISTMQEVCLTILVVLVAYGFALPVDYIQTVLKNHSGQFENVTKPQPELRLALVDKKYYWPNGIVHYTIDPSYTPAEEGYIKDAMREIEVNSCVRFVERTNEVNYVRIESEEGKGCESYIGMRGGAQPLRLEKEKCFNPKTAKGHALHEFMHVLGFFHQHNAENRDDYIKVVTKNIERGKLDYFTKLSKDHASDFDFGYDYDSIMHYNKWAYPINKENPTIIPKGDPDRQIGQRLKLSAGDIRKLNFTYDCT